MMATMARILIVLIAAISLAACTTTRTLDSDELERQIAAGIETQTGASVASVDCPDDVPLQAGHSFSCTATADDGSSATVAVTQTDDQGNVEWEVTGVD